MPLKFNLSHLTLIALLNHRTSPHTVTKLTYEVGCSVQTMYRLIRRLIAAGLVEEDLFQPKLPEDKTRPHRRLVLTRDGRSYARTYREEQQTASKSNRRRSRK